MSLVMQDVTCVMCNLYNEKLHNKGSERKRGFKSRSYNIRSVVKETN